MIDLESAFIGQLLQSQDVVTCDQEAANTSATGFNTDIAIGWTGIAPQFGIQGSDESKSEGLAKVVASITGEDVKITAKRLIAQINAVAQNATVHAERVESKDEPIPYLDHTKTSYGISVSAQVGKDGARTIMKTLGLQGIETIGTLARGRA